MGVPGAVFFNSANKKKHQGIWGNRIFLDVIRGNKEAKQKEKPHFTSAKLGPDPPSKFISLPTP